MKQPSPTDIRSESVRDALAKIAEAHGGYLSPGNIVDAARNPKSVLHDEFDWDDHSAADSYRLAQARALVRRVKFTIIRQSKEKPREVEMIVTRAYSSRISARSEDGGYESVQTIMSDEVKREELVYQVLRELNAYRKRYADIIALSDIWTAIDSATEELAPASQGMAGQAESATGKAAVA